MIVNVISRGKAHVVALSGDFLAVEAASVRRVCQDLQDQGELQLVIDFSEVDSVDGFSLASLVGLRSRLRQRGGDLALVGVNPDLRKRLQSAYLEQVFPIYSTQAQAFEKLSP